MIHQNESANTPLSDLKGYFFRRNTSIKLSANGRKNRLEIRLSEAFSDIRHILNIDINIIIVLIFVATSSFKVVLSGELVKFLG